MKSAHLGAALMPSADPSFSSHDLQLCNVTWPTNWDDCWNCGHQWDWPGCPGGLAASAPRRARAREWYAKPWVKDQHVEHAREHALCAVGCTAVHCPFQLPPLFNRTHLYSSWCGTFTAIDRAKLAAGRALVSSDARSSVSQLSNAPAHADAWRRFLRTVLPQPGAPSASDSTSASSAAASSDAAPPRARVIALGGSMTSGIDCADATLPTSNTPDCAFPHRVVSALREGLGATDIDFVSLAVGGMTMKGQLPVLPLVLRNYAEGARLGMPTLLLVDFSANDVLDGPWQDTEPNYTPRRDVTEAFVRYVLDHQPQLALLLVETYYGQANNLATPRAYRDVSIHYGVPHVRYANVIADGHLAYNSRCPLAKDPSQQLGCHAHVRWTAHQAIADVLVTTLVQLGAELLTRSPTSPTRSPTSSTSSSSAVHLPAQLAPTLPVMCEPLREYVAAARYKLVAFHQESRRQTLVEAAVPPAKYRGSGFLFSGAAAAFSASTYPRVLRGNWTLYEDRRGKPGWISHGPNGSTLAFELEFGKWPAASLVYLRGFDGGLAEVRVRMADVVNGGGSSLPFATDNVAMIDSLRRDGINVTQSALFEFDAHQPKMQNYAMEPYSNQPRVNLPPRGGGGAQYDTSEGHHGFGLPAHSRGTMEVSLFCRAMPCRFKLLSVTSC